MIRKVTKLWTKKDGTKIRICDLSIGHLNNCIAMMERIAENGHNSSIADAYAALCFMQGEMAIVQTMNAIDRMELDFEGDCPPSYYPDIYYDLIREKKRREELVYGQNLG